MLHLSQASKDEASCTRGSGCIQAPPPAEEHRALSLCWEDRASTDLQHDNRHDAVCHSPMGPIPQIEHIEIWSWYPNFGFWGIFEGKYNPNESVFSILHSTSVLPLLSQCRLCYENQACRTSNRKETKSVEQHWAAKWMDTYSVTPTLV